TTMLQIDGGATLRLQPKADAPVVATVVDHGPTTIELELLGDERDGHVLAAYSGHNVRAVGWLAKTAFKPVDKPQSAPAVRSRGAIPTAGDPLAAGTRLYLEPNAPAAGVLLRPHFGIPTGETNGRFRMVIIDGPAAAIARVWIADK